jgi:hypothetical protein
MSQTDLTALILTDDHYNDIKDNDVHETRTCFNSAVPHT